MKKLLRVAFLILGIVIGLIGCSSKSNNSDAISLHVAIATKYMSDEKAKSFAQYLNAGLPEYNDGNKIISVSGLLTGNPEEDPYSLMAATARIGSMMSSGEIELWICDEENAIRYSADGTSYVALSALFTEEELGSLGGALIRVPLTDSEGNKTGAYSEICGIDLSQHTAITELIGISDPQMFIMVGTDNMDAAKAAFLYLAK